MKMLIRAAKKNREKAQREGAGNCCRFITKDVYNKAVASQVV